MDKKLFWKGYIAGIILTIIFGAFKFIYPVIFPPSLSYKEFKLQDLNGNLISSSTIFVNKPTVVNIWATWCQPCVAEFPSFEKMKSKYGDKVNFIMVSEEDIAKITKFKDKKKYSLAIVKSLKTNAEYGISAIPVTYFFDKNGNLIETSLGGLDEVKLEEEVKKLLD